MGVTSAVFALLLHHHRADAGLCHVRPDVERNVAAWSQALDKAGALLAIWSLVFIAGVIVAFDLGNYLDEGLPPGLAVSVLSLVTILGLFYGLNDLRPALHTATRGRHRGRTLRNWRHTLTIAVFAAIGIYVFLVAASDIEPPDRGQDVGCHSTSRQDIHCSDNARQSSR